MRFLLRVIPSSGDTGSAEASLRRMASNLGARAVNPKRTSYGALEMDVFAASREDFELFLAVVEPLGRVEFHRDLQVPFPHRSREATIAEAVSLFDTERYWEAHEVLESMWRVSSGAERGLLQGLILVCAAFVHVQKNEKDVAIGIARRALPLLAWSANSFHRVDVGALRTAILAMVEAQELKPVRL